MSELTYFTRLKRLNLESLEIRRLRADLTLVYKMFFGLVRINSELFFARRNRPYLRGHKYVLDKQRCNSTARQSFVSARVINVWNNLPDSTDFRCLRSFNRSVSSVYLSKYCKVNLL